MITENQVITQFLEYQDADNVPLDLIAQCCRYGLQWVQKNLKRDADPDDPLIIQTASILAHYFLFMKKFTENERYSSYKVGDMTVHKDILKEYEFENKVKQTAILNASSILIDRGFGFYAC